MHAIGVGLSANGQRAVSEGARAYKYQRPRLSFLETAVLDKYWDRVASFYPMWLAPNLVTATGGVFVLLATLLVFTLSPRLLCEAPMWMYPTVALLLFSYQTMDGSDGKQARRTSSGSALGHLVDHGLDSMVGLLGVTWSVDALGWGVNHPFQPLMVCGIQSCFFLSNLVALHSGTQQFFFIDVQESQFAIMLGVSANAVLGHEFFLTTVQIPFLGVSLELRSIVTLIVLGGFLQNSVLYLLYTFRVYVGGQRPEPRPGRGLLRGLHQVALLAAHIGLSYLNWRARSESLTRQAGGRPVSVLELLPLYVQTVVGFGGLTLQLLVTTVTQLPFPLLHYSVVLQLVGYATFSVGLAWLDWLLAAAVLFSYCTFVRQVAATMCASLGIRVFRIPVRPAPK